MSTTHAVPKDVQVLGREFNKLGREIVEKQCRSHTTLTEPREAFALSVANCGQCRLVADLRRRRREIFDEFGRRGLLVKDS